MKKLLLLALPFILASVFSTSTIASGYSYDSCPSLNEIKFLPDSNKPGQGYYEAQTNYEWKTVVEYPAGAVNQFSHAIGMNVQGDSTTVGGISCFYQLSDNSLIFLAPFPDPTIEFNILKGEGSNWRLNASWSGSFYLCQSSDVNSCPFIYS